MNRQEIITKIQNDINKFFKSYESIGEDERELLNEIFDDVEKLRQPITLTEFLEMEENVIYTDGKVYYKIKNGNLFFKTNGKIPQVWNLSGYNEYLKSYDKFRELEKADIVEVQE